MSLKEVMILDIKDRVTYVLTLLGNLCPDICELIANG
jgi:hypothetical protein